MHRLLKLPARRGYGAILLMLATVACGDSPTETGAAQGACLPSGSLSVAVYGGIRRDLAWSAPELECSGMPRPNGAGARLRFAGPAGDDAQSLAFIVGLPELERGATASETPANVTLILEDTGRFFSSAESPVCWSDVTEQSLVEGTTYRVTGIVYCVSPLAELNGSSGVTFTDLEFSGIIDWGDPE